MTRIAGRRPWSVGPTVLTPASHTLPGAPCKQAQPDEWFQGDGERTEEWAARQHDLIATYCHACPLMWKCRANALKRGEVFGVWGGMTEDELRSRRKRALGVAA
jgi:alkanesulfonate monooxygenase SsuD/methylene tetrahydromethanopterin reductase-like flavin-dependent oxidoreductase (luciferase family)